MEIKSNNEEEQKQRVIVEQKKEKINVFSVEHINKIFNSKTPIEDISLLLESNYRKVYLRADFDKGQLMAKAEYFVNVLVFLKDKFKNFEDEIICRLMNLFNELINLENDEVIDNDYLKLSKKKLNDFKIGLDELNLIPKRTNEINLSKDPNKKITQDGKFYLNLKEIKELISYLQTDYLPYIRLWYYLKIEKREIKNETLQIIINRPIPMMPLNMAILEEKPEVKENEQEENKEEIKTDEDKKDENKEQQEIIDEEKQKKENEQKEETYEDILEKLGLNEETKKIIRQKIEELHKSVNDKIDDRKKVLDGKIRELEETVKGKKK